MSVLLCYEQRESTVICKKRRLCTEGCKSECNSHTSVPKDFQMKGRLVCNGDGNRLFCFNKISTRLIEIMPDSPVDSEDQQYFVPYEGGTPIQGKVRLVIEFHNPDEMVEFVRCQSVDGSLFLMDDLDRMKPLPCFILKRDGDRSDEMQLHVKSKV